VVALGLRDAGFEVIYSGIRRSPEEIAEEALQEDVDVVGLSCLSGAHKALFPRVIEELRKRGLHHVLVIGGGVIPKEDIPYLKEKGIAEVFLPGTLISQIAEFIRAHVPQAAPSQAQEEG
jgi:methylmalonyl-CoA mutase C-terminal domain/subunit